MLIFLLPGHRLVSLDNHFLMINVICLVFFQLSPTPLWSSLVFLSLFNPSFTYFIIFLSNFISPSLSCLSPPLCLSTIISFSSVSFYTVPFFFSLLLPTLFFLPAFSIYLFFSFLYPFLSCLPFSLLPSLLLPLFLILFSFFSYYFPFPFPSTLSLPLPPLFSLFFR